MRPLTIFLAAALLAQPPQRDAGLAKFSSSSNLVIVNITAQGREDLKKGDFRIFEDGKPQEIAVFEFQKLDSTPLPPVPTPPPPSRPLRIAACSCCSLIFPHCQSPTRFAARKRPRSFWPRK